MVASDLYSTVSYGGAVQTPGAMCTCAHVFKRLPLGFSVFFFFFFFLSTLGIELTFSLYKNIYSRNLARFARGVLIHATGLSRESIL